jgi:hypothetical protein
MNKLPIINNQSVIVKKNDNKIISISQINPNTKFMYLGEGSTYSIVDDKYNIDTVNYNITSYEDYQQITLTFHATNQTTSSTININGLGEEPLKNAGGLDLLVNEISVGQRSIISRVDGSWRIIGGSSSGGLDPTKIPKATVDKNGLNNVLVADTIKVTFVTFDNKPLKNSSNTLLTAITNKSDWDSIFILKKAGITIPVNSYSYVSVGNVGTLTITTNGLNYTSNYDFTVTGVKNDNGEMVDVTGSFTTLDAILKIKYPIEKQSVALPDSSINCSGFKSSTNEMFIGFNNKLLIYNVSTMGVTPLNIASLDNKIILDICLDENDTVLYVLEATSTPKRILRYNIGTNAITSEPALVETIDISLLFLNNINANSVSSVVSDKFRIINFNDVRYLFYNAFTYTYGSCFPKLTRQTLPNFVSGVNLQATIGTELTIPSGYSYYGSELGVYYNPTSENVFIGFNNFFIKNHCLHFRIRL